jgi:hypothetical protein
VTGSSCGRTTPMSGQTRPKRCGFALGSLTGVCSVWVSRLTRTRSSSCATSMLRQELSHWRTALPSPTSRPWSALAPNLTPEAIASYQRSIGGTWRWAPSAATVTYCRRRTLRLSIERRWRYGRWGAQCSTRRGAGCLASRRSSSPSSAASQQLYSPGADVKERPSCSCIRRSIIIIVGIAGKATRKLSSRFMLRAITLGAGTRRGRRRANWHRQSVGGTECGGGSHRRRSAKGTTMKHATLLQDMFVLGTVRWHLATGKTGKPPWRTATLGKNMEDVFLAFWKNLLPQRLL